MGLACRRTARRIKRLKGVVSAMPSAYATFATPDFLTLSVHHPLHVVEFHVRQRPWPRWECLSESRGLVKTRIKGRYFQAVRSEIPGASAAGASSRCQPSTAHSKSAVQRRAARLHKTVSENQDSPLTVSSGSPARLASLFRLRILVKQGKLIEHSPRATRGNTRGILQQNQDRLHDLKGHGLFRLLLCSVAVVLIPGRPYARCCSNKVAHLRRR
jgi:hypothetical protein